jgi:hypothetical protein
MTSSHADNLSDMLWIRPSLINRLSAYAQPHPHVHTLRNSFQQQLNTENPFDKGLKAYY